MITTETLDERTSQARDRIREATERAETFEAKAAALQAQCQELRREAGTCRAQITALAAYCEAAAAVPRAERGLADSEERFAAAAAHHSESEGRCLQAAQIVRLAEEALQRAGGTRAAPAELVDLGQRLASGRAVLEHEQEALQAAYTSMMQARAPIASYREQVDAAREEAARTWRVAEQPPVPEVAEDWQAGWAARLAERLSASGFGSGRGGL